MKTVIQCIVRQARQLGACSLLTGKESTVDDIVRLFLTPQGLEFCMKHHFPDIQTLRLFKGEGVERFGIYIDAGAVTLTNPEKAVLIGDTQATVRCDTLSRHTVALLQGAQAAVHASAWSVIGVTAEKGCTVTKHTKDRGITL